MSSLSTWEPLLYIVQTASQAVLKAYKGSFSVETKPDDTPVTSADLDANRIILEGLQKYYPKIPVVSEESPKISWKMRQTWSRFFLVDPIDGTSEFVAHQGDFTVNIALIEKGKVVLGLVGVPVSNELFVGFQSQAFVTPLLSGNFTVRTELCHSEKNRSKINSETHILVSVFHKDSKTQKFIEQTGGTVIPMGSSLKFCRIADNTADYYPRLPELHEWDIAAGHGVLKAAGGNVYRMGNSCELIYGSESLKTPPFEAI